MTTAAEELHDEAVISLAKRWAAQFGKYSMDDIMEAAMAQCKVKKGQRPHVKRVLTTFVALFPKVTPHNG